MTISGFRRHPRDELDLIRQMRSGNAVGVGSEHVAITTVSWSTAWRLAVIMSAILAVFGAALYHFLGVPRPVLIVFAAIVALTVGLRLPAVERTGRVSA